MGDLKQNVNSLLAYFKDSSTNQKIKKWLKNLPWRAKPKLPCEYIRVLTSFDGPVRLEMCSYASENNFMQVKTILCEF